MNSDDFPVKKINILPASFQRKGGKRVPGYLINNGGQVCFSLPRMKQGKKSLKADDEVINNLVLHYGFIYIWPIDESIFVSLRPERVNLTSMTAAFYVIACCRPERVFISTDAENTEWEAFSSSQGAMSRIEHLVIAAAKAAAVAAPRRCP
jgi:hypothetical protein